MSAETMLTLNTQTLRGFTDQRGHAWHYMANLQGAESNHYAGAIPAEDVVRRLFHWDALAVTPSYTVPELITPEGVTPAREFTADDRRLIVRSDTGAVLGAFRDSYAIHQYREWLLNTVAMITGDALAIGSAGLLRGGGVGWVQIDAPENTVTPEGVEFRAHILATTSHDGSIATTYGQCVTDVVCDNTRSLALGEIAKNGTQVKVKHSKHSGFQLDTARQALGIVFDTADTFAAQVAELCAIKVTPARFGKFLNLWSPIPEDTAGKRVDPRAVTLSERKREALTSLYKSDPRVAPWNGTGWGVLQAVNTFGQHVAAVRNGSEDVNVKGAARYARSIQQAADGTLAKQEREARSLLTMALA